MRNTQFEIRVLVGNKPITEYEHENDTFIEGRKGSNFVIQVTNKSPNRKLFVISVDGLSIIDGLMAGDDSHGYVISGYQTIDIPGWKVDSKIAANFIFSDKKSSYAANKSNSDNTGVIGLKVFDEVVKRQNTNQLWNNSQPWYDYSQCSGPVYAQGIRDPNKPHVAVYGSILRTANINTASTLSSTTPQVSNSIGTGFGNSVDFATSTTEFEKGSINGTLVLYYDNAKGLKARGIDLSKNITQYTKRPDPFPGAHCTPPIGWRA